MAEVLGKKLLAEIDEGTLEDVLSDLRKTYSQETGIKPARLGLPVLDEIWRRHGGRLEICGHSLALVYHIVSQVVSYPRNSTVVVIDSTGRFDISHLSCSLEDLKHVHILYPTTHTADGVKECLAQVQPYLLYGDHGSRGREFVATVVNGSVGGDICTGWKGWLRVEGRGERVVGFGMGMSVEEAITERAARQKAVQESAWCAVSDWGEYTWMET